MEFNDIQVTLLFGNPLRKIRFGRLPIELEQIMFKPFNYVPELLKTAVNFTTDELVNVMLQNYAAISTIIVDGNLTGDSIDFRQARIVSPFSTSYSIIFRKHILANTIFSRQRIHQSR